jgi:hypothetical protein
MNEKELIKTQFKRGAKKIMAIPRGTSNRMVKILVGTLGINGGINCNRIV